MSPHRVGPSCPSTAARPPMAGDMGEVEGPRCSGQASPTTTYHPAPRSSVAAHRLREPPNTSQPLGRWGHGHIPVIRVPEWIRPTPAVFRARGAHGGHRLQEPTCAELELRRCRLRGRTGAVVHGFELRGPDESPQRKGGFAGWQVQDSNLRRHTPTDLQTADSSALTGGFTVTRRTCALIAASLTPPVGASRPQPDLTEFVVSRCGKRLDGVRRRGPSRSASARRCGR